MSIQHASIPDVYLHEPKGIVASTNHQVYVSNGVGSGVWKRPDSTDLKGMNGDAGSNNLIPVSDGTNGFSMKVHKLYAAMTLTNNGNNFAATAAADPTLNTNTDYALFTGTGAPWALSPTNLGITFTTDRLTVPTTGIYYFDFWANIAGFPNAAGRVGLKYRINGTTFGPRKVIVKSNSGADYGTATGSGIAPFTAGDYIQIMVANSHSGNLLISDATATLFLLHAT